MIGYKLFDMDLKISGFQFEIGKTYEMNDDYRFCRDCFYVFPSLKKLLDNITIYNLGRICEVEIEQEVTKPNELVKKFKILNEIDYNIFKTNENIKYKMLNLMFNHNLEDLDVLVNDENFWVRSLVADFGNEKHLDILVNDKEERVRISVAMRNIDKYLDVLVFDEATNVRQAVIDSRKEKYLNILKNDSNCFIRMCAERILNENSETDLFDYDVNVDGSFYQVIKNYDTWYIKDAIENKMFNIISELTEHKDPVVKEKMNILFHNLTEYSDICDELIDNE